MDLCKVYMLTGYRLSLELADAELLPLRFTGYADVMEAAMHGSRPLGFFKYSRGHQERLKKIKNNSLKKLRRHLYKTCSNITCKYQKV